MSLIQRGPGLKQFGISRRTSKKQRAKLDKLAIAEETLTDLQKGFRERAQIEAQRLVVRKSGRLLGLVR
jgi:hypothetical protein